MAFGRARDTKRIKNAALDDQMFRTHIAAEERNNKVWKKKWDWLLDEYDDLHKKLEEISKTSEYLSEVQKDKREKDTRSIAPIPVTTNHEYGWLASKPEFQTEKYGPDVSKPVPLPTMYEIFKGT